MVGRPARLPDRTTAVNSGRRRRRACAGNTSGGELLATLARTDGDVPRPDDPGSWSLRIGTPRSPPARSRREGGDGGRNRPQTPASITEKRPAPKTGRIPTADGPPATPPEEGGTPEPTRPGASQHRCRAVDEAVSVVVAPRRTSGSRRAGRPPRSTDRRTARSPAPLDSDLQRCRSVPDRRPGPAASVADRAQPVDTDVDPVRPRIHNG